MKLPKIHRLSYRQMVTTALVALAGTLLLSGVHLLYELPREKTQVDQRIAHLINLVSASSAKAVYEMDEPLAERLINGVLGESIVLSATIVDDFGNVLAEKSRERPPARQALYNDIARWIFDDGDVHQISLYFGAWPEPVGYLRLRVDYPGVVESVVKRAALSVLMAALRDIALALAIALIFYLTITRPLLHLVHQLSTVDPDDPGETDVSVSKGHQSDELGLLARTINRLLDAVSRSIARTKSAESEVQERQARLQAIMANVPDAVLIIGEDGAVESHNTAAERLFGISDGSLPRTRVGDLLGEAVEHRLTQFVESTEADGGKASPTPFPSEMTRTTADGLERHLELRFGDARLSGGRLIICVIRDITIRRRAEAFLRISEERFRSVFHTTPDLTCLVRTEDGRYLDANPAFLRAADLKAESLSAHTIHECSPYLEEGMVGTLLQAVAAAGTVENREIRYRDADGEPRTGLVSARLVHLKDETHALLAIRDISELKRTQEALRASEEKYRRLFENATDAIFIAQDGHVKFPNPSTLRLLKRSETEIVTRPFAEFIHEDDREMVVEFHKRRLNGGESQPPGQYSFRVVSGEEKTRWVQTDIVPVIWEGRPATLNFMQDITDQKRMEEQLQQALRMESVGRLAGGVAHDFNNLLMGIQGRTSLMLADTAKDDPRHTHLEGIEAYVKSATDLTRQLLGFARGGKYEVKTTDMNPLVARQADMFGRTHKEVSIDQKLAPDLWPVAVDRGQMEQVLLNLYVNAWQAMPEGGALFLRTENVVLDAEYVRALDAVPGNYVRLSVTDTGVGMDEKTRKRIFEPFFTTRGMGRGTGLGLASAYGIIQNHKGFISVYSEVGHGTTFNIYLPAAEAQVKEGPVEKAAPFSGEATIMLVDDEEMILDVGGQMLSRLGYKVITAQGGHAAIERLKADPEAIQLVILDMVMPDLSGGDTFDRLIEIDPKVRVILSSGYSMNGKAQRILDRGCVGFIQKPFNLNQLAAKVNDVLRVDEESGECRLAEEDGGSP